MESKRRNSKKKSLPIELPQSVLDQYSCIENLLRHSLSRKWLRYEFDYDAVEDGFFNQNNSKTFAGILSHKYPSLKSRNLTMVEWRKIRKLVFRQESRRRFSPKFVQQQRIDLEKYRRCYNVLRENQRDDQLVKLNAMPSNKSVVIYDERPELEMYRLILDTSKKIALKIATVAKLREINSAKTVRRIVNDEESTGNATKTIIKLRNTNEEIMNNLKKLLHFQIVKDALFFDALSKKKLFLALSPVYFHRKCELRIQENRLEYRLDTLIESVGQLLNVILEMILCFIDYQHLAINAEDYLKTFIEQQHDKLKLTMAPDDFMYFIVYIEPLGFVIAKKVNS